ncbi:MAG: aminotransferase class I/II-fold pyridoxal phosphate-dependent enzyme [Candidatus Altiarchaeota archaeon]|nr:aminotransferase class I/II-fold pyridoxal phosphate-dependent enzyme [Candidatus Altiarchaeota archaeon]
MHRPAGEIIARGQLDGQLSIQGLVDPISTWELKVRNLGAKRLLTISKPDPAPQDVMRFFDETPHPAVMEDSGSRLLQGSRALRERLVEVDRKFGTDYSKDDADRLYLTEGVSGALSFTLSLFSGSDVLIQRPGWGTVYTMARVVGCNPVPCDLFEGGVFNPEKADSAVTKRTKAVFMNMPSNPEGMILPDGEVRKFAEYCVDRKLHVVSDEVYKYLRYVGRNYSPLNAPGASENVTVVSSMSKVYGEKAKPGYARLSPALLREAGRDRIADAFGKMNQTPSPESQSSLLNAIEHHEDLAFMYRIVDGYFHKTSFMADYLEGLGCTVPYRPNAGYFVFARAPEGMDGASFVERMAGERGVGMLPGVCFGGGDRRYDDYFRVSLGDGVTYRELDKLLGDALPDTKVAGAIVKPDLTGKTVFNGVKLERGRKDVTITSSSMIHPKNVGWVVKQGITDIISLEPMQAGTKTALASRGVKTYDFPVRDDTDVVFGESDVRSLVGLVKGILEKNQKGSILIHCEHCNNRTPEAIRVLTRELGRK